MTRIEELNKVLRYEVGTIVKIIDPDELHIEWATFEIIECRYNTESVDWNYFLLPLDTTVMFDEALWVKKSEICPVELTHHVDTRDIF